MIRDLVGQGRIAAIGQNLRDV
ncbi:MAG: hypothetical protein QOJ42_4236, partial [Acidobacteriaceae bacterium]|nr:hypothetical protein [Acidobacteriaceae bacterium]